MRFELQPADDGKHKYVGIFTQDDHVKKVPFGAKGYEDLTTHKNLLRKERYIQRHRTREDWTVPTNKGTLSRYILWENPSLQTSVRLFKQRFNLS